MVTEAFMALFIVFSILSVIGFGMGLIAWIEVKALQKSTHSIQYVPAGDKFESVTKDLEEKLTKDLFQNV